MKGCLLVQTPDFRKAAGKVERAQADCKVWEMLIAAQTKELLLFSVSAMKWQVHQTVWVPRLGEDPCEGGIYRVVFLWLDDELSPANQVHVCDVKDMSLSVS